MRTHMLWKLTLVSLLLGGSCCAAADPAPIDLTIEAGQPGARIQRDIFGQFAEHLGTGIYGGIWVGKDSPIPNVRGIRSDVVAALRALKVPDVRWPGGCFADEYHWRDGIGPGSARKSTINTNWGGALEPNTFGTDEFMDFIGQIGSEAYISVNLGSGSVREAADWIEYLTAAPTSTAGKERAANGHPEPYRVKFLGLGNESWGCGGALSPDFYVNEMRRYSRFVHNYNPTQTGDQAMRRIAVGADGAKTDYLDAVMKAWHDKVWSWDIEAVSLHSYTSAGWPPARPSQHFGEDQYALLLGDTLHMEDLISTHSALMDRYDPEKKVALAVDEWGIWLAPLPGTNPGFLVQQNSLRDALLAALNLNIFARHADRVRMANIAQMQNVLQAIIRTDGPRMVLTPTYHVFRMYVPFQDAITLPVHVDAGRYTFGGVTLPRVDAIAARRPDGAIVLSVVNLDPTRPVTLRTHLSGAAAHFAQGEQLTAPRVDAVNTFESPKTVVPQALAPSRTTDGTVLLTLPAKSVSVIQFDQGV
jgi:alpha-N-arabinofuranosidase